MTWIYLALLAPLLFGIVTLIDDNLLQNFYRSPAAATAVTGVFGLLPGLAILGFKDTVALPFHLAAIALGAGIVLMFYYYYYFIGLDRANPSVVAALFCLSPALVPFLAYFIVDERLSATAIIGLVIVIVAAFAYSLTEDNEGEGFKISKALLPIVLASVLFDIASVANKYVYDKSDFYSAYIYFSIGTFLGGLIFVGVMLYKKEFPKILGLKTSTYIKVGALLTATELINVAAEFVHDKALSLGSVSLVNVLDNLQPLYVLLVTAALYPLLPKLFREAQGGKIRLKLILALGIVAGAYLAVR